MRSNWKRRVIPRWRQSTISASLADTAPSSEFKAAKLLGRAHANEKSDLAREVDVWSQSPTLGVAADLLNFAHDQELRQLLSAPAKFVLDSSLDLSPQLRAVAARTLGSALEPSSKKPSIHSKISDLKRHLAFNPRDSIASVDMARLYAIKGQNGRALNAIRRAVALQPDNRFVLRSASRFYIHDDRADEAFSILKRSARTQEDPWLMASLISVEAIQNRSPMYYKKAKSMIDANRFAPFHTAELNAAIATCEANAGQFKNARRLFSRALNDPNDNALAQAIWASNEFVFPVAIDPNWLTRRFSSEANYYAQEHAGDFNAALEAAMQWFEDEPFSTRPLIAASFTASILGEFATAQDQLQTALNLDPDDDKIKNNLVFALANQGLIPEAERLLLDIYNSENKRETEISGHTFANLGLLFYRRGDHESGRKFYDLADTVLSKQKDAASRAIALSFWVQEAVHSQDEQLSSIVDRAKAIIDLSNSTAAKAVFARATGTVAPELAEKDRLVRNAITLDHDKEKNILTIIRKKSFNG